MTRWVRSPVAGSAVNITPEISESTMRWTTTAIAGSSPSLARHWRRHGAPQRGPALADVCRPGRRPLTLVETSSMPANEGGRGVLGRGRRPHRHQLVRTQFVVGVEDRPAHLVGQAGGPHQALELGGHPGERRGIVDVQPHDPFAQRMAHAGGVQGGEVGRRGDDETGRHGDAGQGQLAQVGALAAHPLDVVPGQLGEPGDEAVAVAGDRFGGLGVHSVVGLRRHALSVVPPAQTGQGALVLVATRRSHRRSALVSRTRGSPPPATRPSSAHG